VRLQGRFYLKWHSAPHLSTDHKEFGTQESTHVSIRLCNRPRREVRRGTTDEMEEVPGESTRD
jgi:hypothetical protein